MVKTDLWIIAVNIIQPYLVVDYLSGFLSTDLADAAVHR